MDRATALLRLPEVYSAALQLRDAGADGPDLAARLGLCPEAVGPLLRLAEAKLGELLEEESPPEP